MTPTSSQAPAQGPFAAWALAALLPTVAAMSAIPMAAHANTTTSANADNALRRCTALSGNNRARLACFDAWAAAQPSPKNQPSPTSPAWQAPAASAATLAPAVSAPAQPDKAMQAEAPGNAVPAPVDTTLPATRVIDVARVEGCRDPQYSDLSRFWELESGTDCGTFSFRGYRPITVSVVTSSSVNRQPTSTAEGNSATNSTQYRRTENRIQLSVRTKIAQGLLTQGNPTLKDSVWFGYTQQSYWQLFTPQISRPFRSTDHEPEVMYVYPTTAQLPFGWKWRYSGLGLVHQSNGQSKPLSRSWNRAYLMTGIELDNRFSINAKLWKRIPERMNNDDNPGISDYVGRSELAVAWNLDKSNTLGATLRHSLASSDRGSLRLDWMQTLGSGMFGAKSNLRLHTALFSGYGDSMIDYNRKRTVLSVGFSLVDF
ncbi:MAG: phospholipase A [Burkholderiaceae bacterium]|nr:phospholipase A [Burkholderiaceae bacterium]